MMEKIAIRGLFLPVGLAVLALVACGPGKAEKEKAVATVNGAEISVTELQREIEGYGKNSPITRYSFDDSLNVLIEKKLLIQEAIKMGIPKDEKFAESIKTFWEQTIIKKLLDSKAEEMSRGIIVSNTEIANEYDRMKFNTKIRAVRGIRTKEDADAAVALMQSGQKVEGEEEIGPIFYEDVRGTSLALAFDMKKDQIAAFNIGKEFIVIGVTQKLPVELPPLKELEKPIKKALYNAKRQKALDEWLASVKKAAKLEIDEEELRRISHE